MRKVLEDSPIHNLRRRATSACSVRLKFRAACRRPDLRDGISSVLPGQKFKAALIRLAGCGSCVTGRPTISRLTEYGKFIELNAFLWMAEDGIPINPIFPTASNVSAPVQPIPPTTDSGILTRVTSNPFFTAVTKAPFCDGVDTR